jgi:hypothetical protein
MWKIAISNLPNMGDHQTAAVKQAPLSGRQLDPWRSVLAIARWLDIPGLHQRMENLMVSYHNQKPELEGENEIQVLLMSIEALMTSTRTDQLIFSAHDLQRSWMLNRLLRMTISI